MPPFPGGAGLSVFGEMVPLRPLASQTVPSQLALLLLLLLVPQPRCSEETLLRAGGAVKMDFKIWVVFYFNFWLFSKFGHNCVFLF